MTQTINKAFTRDEPWLLVAEGDQAVTASFTSGAGQWALHNENTFPLSRMGQFLGQQPVSMQMNPGDYLFVKGSGIAVLTAETPAIASD